MIVFDTQEWCLPRMRKKSGHECQYLWHFQLRGSVFTYSCHWPVCPCVPPCQFDCLPDKHSPQPEHFVPELFRLKRESHTWIMWLSRTGFRVGLKHWFQVYTLTIFSCRSTNPLIHSHMHPQTNPVRRNRNAALPTWGVKKSVHFPSKGLVSDESLVEGYSAASSWVVSLPSRYHLHLPHVEVKMFSIAWRCIPGHLGHLLASLSGWGSSIGQKTCYVNVSRVAEMSWMDNLISSVLFGVQGRAKESSGGAGFVILPSKEVLLWVSESYTWLDWKWSSCVDLHPCMSVLSSHKTPSDERVKRGEESVVSTQACLKGSQVGKQIQKDKTWAAAQKKQNGFLRFS